MVVKVVSSEPLIPKRVVCVRCYYELEYTPVDVSTGSRRDQDETRSYKFIVCPRAECRAEIIVMQSR